MNKLRTGTPPKTAAAHGLRDQKLRAGGIPVRLLFTPEPMRVTLLPNSNLRRSIDFTPEPDLSTDVAWHCRVFAAPLEREFLEHNAKAWLRIARNWLRETFGLGIMMIWGAALSGRHAVVAVLVLQSLAGLPAALLAFCVLPRLLPGWQRDVMFGAVGLVVVCCIAAQGWWMSPAYANRYVMASGLALFSILRY